MNVCFPPCPVALTLPFPQLLAITGVSPNHVVCTAPNTLVHIYGQEFTPTSAVQLDGVAQATTFVSPDELTFNAPSSTVLTPKNSVIKVKDGTKTAQGSVAFAFIPAPVITCPLVPASARKQTPDVQVTVNGSNFTSTCVVHFDGAAKPTTVLSATQLRWTAPSSLEASPRTATITVKDGAVTTGSCPFDFTASVEDEAEAPRRRRRAE